MDRANTEQDEVIQYIDKTSACPLPEEGATQYETVHSNIYFWVNPWLKMTQQMHNLSLLQNKKHSMPSSPSAAKRLYRNLSEKLKGSHTSFDEAYFRARSDRLSLRKASMNFQCNEAMFEAVEQQDLAAVQILLYQYTLEALDLNTPNSEGLTPLDIAILTNNIPIARTLLHVGAKESPHFVNVESRSVHLSKLVQEAQQRVTELSAQVVSEGLGTESAEKEKQLKGWEWRARLYQRMKDGYEHARAPEAPTNVCLMVTSSTSLTVTFQEPLSVNSAVVTKYKVEWSSAEDFSPLAGEIIMDNLHSLRCSITGLRTGQRYYVRVSAYNMRGWGPPRNSTPEYASPSNWKDCSGREPRHRGHTEALERLLQQVRAAHQHYNCRESSKLQNAGRKQSVSRSLKHLFHSSNKFVKTLKRGLYLSVILFYKDNLLVTNEDQIPIVEIDDSHSSSVMQDFLWFTKLSCMWDDIRWLRQNMAVSVSSSTALQARQKMLSAAAQLQNLLGTHNLGRVFYEPIKDRHGNMVIVTVREVESLYSFFNGKWMQVSKLQSQRKSLSTPEEPTALDILLITIQVVLCFSYCVRRLPPGLYLGYLKLLQFCGSDQSAWCCRSCPNVLCHVKNPRQQDEWEWIQTLSGSESVESMDQTSDCPTQLFLYELQTAVKALLKQINLPLHQAKHFRLYTQEVLELGHNVSFLLLLPASDDVCTAPGQNNPYTPHSGFLNLPLQMFELVHFCCYKEKFISLYCRLSAVIELDSLKTQQSLREAISDSEVAAAKQRHQQVINYIQQIDEIWRDMRWITEALQYARYKQPAAGLPIKKLVDLSEEHCQKKMSSTSSHLDCLPSPPPSPEPRIQRRKAVNDSQPCSDEEGCSEVFLPTDSDYDSSDALSPRELDLIYSSSQNISQQAGSGLSGSAPNVLQVHDMKPCLALREGLTECGTLDTSAERCTEQMSSLTMSGSKQPLGFLGKKKLGKHQHYNYFSRQHRWLRVHSETQSGSLSEGVYTQHLMRSPDLSQEPTSGEQVKIPIEGSRSTFVPHASSLPEEGKGKYEEPRQDAHRTHVEPYETTFVDEEGKSWAMSMESVENTDVHSAMQQITSPDEQLGSAVPEVFSSTL
uniref:Ankyrin repeat and fibronectin type III domain containing 1 n=1 Tax=Corvus moneduloides TaxID=1196302 RepID=A0A8C3E9T8_CORMO